MRRTEFLTRSDRRSPGSAGALALSALLVTTACTKLIGLPDLPDLDTDASAGEGGTTAVAGGSNPNNPSGGTNAQGASGRGVGGSSKGGASGRGGSGSSGTSGSDPSDAGSGGLGTASGGSVTAGGAGRAGAGTGGSADTGGSAGAGTGGTPACTVCGGSCVDLATTKQHCGACGYACVNGRDCVAGQCTPAWQPIATSGAPVARLSHAAAFIAGKYVVIGGCLTWDGPAVVTTGAYDPATDRWSALAPLKAARGLHQAVSTGTEIYTFGGRTSCSSNDGSAGPGLERFVPNSGQGEWTTVSAVGEPDGRYDFNMVWTGAAVMVFGGHLSLPTSTSAALFAPASPSSWTDVSCALMNCDRSVGASFKDGNVIRFMGGEYNLDYPDWKGNVLPEATGLSYNPGTKIWNTWSHPLGTPAIISTSPWADDGRRIYFPTGGSVGIYDRITGWLPRDSAPMPSGFCASGATYAWSGKELIGWGSGCSQAAAGARYQPLAPP